MNKKLFEKIVEVVSHFTDVVPKDILSKSRKTHIIDARYMIIYVAHRCGMKWVYIQRYFSLLDHDLHYTTLFHAKNRIEEAMAKDEFVKEMVDQILINFNPEIILED